MEKRKLLRALYYFLPVITVGFGFYIAKNVWVAMIGYHFFAMMILISEKQISQFKRLFTGGKVGKITLWSVLALTSGTVLFGLGVFLNISNSLRVVLSQMGLSENSWLFFIAYYSLVNPVIEEVYWRGFLGSESKGISWSDIGYAGYHPLVFMKFLAAPWGFLEFIILAMVGWLWRGMVQKHGGLLIPYAMHLCADLSIAIAIYLLTK